MKNIFREVTERTFISFTIGHLSESSTGSRILHGMSPSRFATDLERVPEKVNCSNQRFYSRFFLVNYDLLKRRMIIIEHILFRTCKWSSKAAHVTSGSKTDNCRHWKKALIHRRQDSIEDATLCLITLETIRTELIPILCDKISTEI